MIATLSLNPAVDKIVSVQGPGWSGQPSWGDHLRVKKIQEVAAGKGINVARVIKKLGGEVIVLGLAGGSQGEWLKDELKKEKLKFDFVTTSGNVRQSLTIMDERRGRELHLREEGPAISSRELDLFRKKLKKWSPYLKFLVISGRLPAGVPLDFYGEIISFFKKIEVPVLLDANGPAYRRALKAGPDYLKPNHLELEELAGRKLRGRREEMAFIRGLLRSGLKIVTVTHGPGEVLAMFGDFAYLLKPPRLKARNTVGCGDAVTGALAYGLAKGIKIDEILKLAVACGSANALSLGAGFFNINKMRTLLRKVHVEVLPHYGY